jgi:hypothetical protein
MNKKIKLALIHAAENKHGVIIAPGSKQVHDECFMVIGARLCFWYNDMSNNTHLLRYDLALEKII